MKYLNTVTIAYNISGYPNSKTISCTSINDYQNLTVDNFFPVAHKQWMQGTNNSITSFNITQSYDAITGNYTVGIINASGTQKMSGELEIYVITAL